MTVIEPARQVVRGPRVWPLGVEAYHALGDLGLIPEKTELLYGQVYHQMPKSPFHTYLLQLLHQLLLAAVPSGFITQDSGTVVLGLAGRPKSLSVRWSGGQQVEVAVPADAKSVTVTRQP